MTATLRTIEAADDRPATVTAWRNDRGQVVLHLGRDVDSDRYEDAETYLRPDEARALAAALLAVVDAVEPGKRCACGKAAAHLFADPDSAEWACRVPDGAR